MLTFGTIICTYKRPHLLEQCLASWCSSNFLPEQFIVVDATPDAEQYSSDLTDKFSRLFKKPNSQYIITDKPGLTRQRNLGLKNINTDIVCFADDDALISTTYTSKILDVFKADSQSKIGGVNGVSVGQFDNWKQKRFRLTKNYFRHHFGAVAQRIHVPREYTQLFEPLPSQLHHLSLIQIDRLWGANMNYRTELIYNSGFDETFQRYGLYEDVDMSVRVGKTHKLVCCLDAKVEHDEILGKNTRPNDAKYFLASWLNSAYIIEKLFPCKASREAHQHLFKIIKLISKQAPSTLRNSKLRLLGSAELFLAAEQYVTSLQSCPDLGSLQAKFLQFQNEISSLDL
jgi:glycosyltransferase involved in cell wall biosynthesis